MDPKDKSAVQDFLGEFSNEKEVNPFEDNLKDPFVQDETPDETVVEDKEEKPLPFHKDPKVQKYIQKELEKFKKEMPAPSAKDTPTADDDDYYVRLIGNDTPEKLSMIKEAKARDERLLQQAEERAFGRLTKEQQAQIEAEKAAETELENAFENIEETYEVDFSTPTGKKTRQEFVSFVERIAPKDTEGNIVDYPDMPSAWETFQEIKKSTQQPSRAKELASRSMARSSETTVKTPQRVDWNSVDNALGL